MPSFDASPQSRFFTGPDVVATTIGTYQRRISASPASAEKDQVNSLLAAMTQPTGAGHIPLDDALRDVAALAARLVPGADGAGLAIPRPDLVTISATAPSSPRSMSSRRG
jgi:hypothetical protein